tara:strand:+ start:3716 stop:4030 length:315 start_codon:yes stop_codon:yes gene_type:complete
MFNIIATTANNDDKIFNNSIFNEYLSIILDDTEAYNILISEIDELIENNDKKTIVKYVTMFQKFNENFIFETAKTITNRYKKFIYVERSLDLLNLIKKLEKQYS